MTRILTRERELLDALCRALESGNQIEAARHALRVFYGSMGMY